MKALTSPHRQQGTPSAEELQTAAQVARTCREQLGIAGRPALPEDPFLLLACLPVRLRFDAELVDGGRILMWGGARPDSITLYPDPNAWRLAWVLAHELGHHLLTQPLPWALVQSYRAEVAWSEEVADAFAAAFMGMPRSEVEAVDEEAAPCLS